MYTLRGLASASRWPRAGGDTGELSRCRIAKAEAVAQVVGCIRTTLGEDVGSK
jgi:hypothetical protein